MFPHLGSPDGVESAVVDSPLYDRVLMRSMRRWVGLGDLEDVYIEYDDGNGVEFLQ